MATTTPATHGRVTLSSSLVARSDLRTDLTASADLCPRCALDEVPIDSRSGWCAACDAEARVERYAAARKAEVEARSLAWLQRWDRERQRTHRLRAKLKPREVASVGTDPLQLGYEALTLVRRLGLRSQERLGIAEQLCDLIRVLAWGPGS